MSGEPEPCISDTDRSEILDAVDAILRRNALRRARECGPVALEIFAAFANRGWRPIRKEGT